MGRTASLFAAILVVGLAGPLPPVAGQTGYQLPPQAVVDLVDAPPTPSVRFSPDGAWMAMLERSALPALEDVARPMLRLAGLRIDPASDSRYATSFDVGLKLAPVDGGRARTVPLANGARLSGTSWSHTSRHLAYTLATDEGTELWVLDVIGMVRDGAQPVRLTDRLNTVLEGTHWMPDGSGLLALTVPADRGPAPQAPRVPAGPNIQESTGQASPLRTYQDLLGSAHDAELFAHHALADISVFDLASGEARVIGEADVIMDVSVSPDGQQLLVTRLAEPFPFTAPYYQFARRIEVISLQGQRQFVVADLPVDENVPIGGVHTGRRSVAWRAGQPATVVWVEALDGGDPKREVEHRDRWMAVARPFAQEPLELLRTEHRAWGLTWLGDTRLVMGSEYDRDERWTRTTLHDLSDAGAAPVVLEDRSIRDRYGDPGRAWTEPDASGRDVVRLDGRWMYRMGSGASPEGLAPFLDRQDVTTGGTERLWRCGQGSYESVVHLSGDGQFITRHETQTSPPNYVMHTGGSLDRGNDTTWQRPLTEFPDPQPTLREVHKELVTYERADGVPLSATLYLPAGYEPGERLPLLIWAYPIEFNDAATAGQVNASEHRFTSVRGSSHLALLTQGYAILDGATMPIIGSAESMNDTFIEQLVLSAEAAIDFAVERGVADRNRVAVGGHSYGAFMTANLLAHCDLFAAGIARSGAYNRTLTPFGFQSERRTVWEATDSYVAISPFLHADKIKEPMLMIHGEVDNNSGTFPLQSERMYGALKGNGGVARLVMLPHESHGYRARESVLHVQHEMADWLDQHLKPSAE
jgi:dipeptidyl aminopeptidase/acylaminoacyl peptidase